MTTPKWQPFGPRAFEGAAGVEFGSFIIVARPDGKSWSGILGGSDKASITIANANNRTELHFAMNPTASFMVLPKPKWEIGFGERRLPL